VPLVLPGQSSEDLVKTQGICYTEVPPSYSPMSQSPQHASTQSLFTPSFLALLSKAEDLTLGTALRQPPSSSRIDYSLSYN
jgi:hypothetical protein